MATACSSCGRSNRDDARFCDGCGGALPASCRECGRDLRPEARFCDGCGHDVSAPAVPNSPTAEEPRDPRSYTPKHLAERILVQKAALVGERKQVSVLFADVSDFTSLAESADPEAMHDLMDRSFQIALDEIHRFEGTVNQFTGDGFMALFGAPIALEDAPQRAVLAALATQQALAQLDAEVHERFGRSFRMRMGIHSGPVVVGSIGDDLRMDYTAVGDTTNLAARLQQAARPGSVWISEATASRVNEFFELTDLGALEVKGKSAPVRAFEVGGALGVSDHFEAAADSGLTPLFGRDQELAMLRSAFDSAREGRGQVVQIAGEAGIGKSRLIYEFRQSLANEPHAWIEGRCSPFASTTAFQVVADAMRRSFGIDDRDDEASALAKLGSAAAAFHGKLDWTIPYMRHLLSLSVDDAEIAAMDAMDRRAETYRALQSWFLQSAESQPVVLVAEDLHWVDAASQEFLAFVAEALPATRVLLVVTYRPGYEHPFGERSYHRRLALQALSGGAMSSMAGALLDSTDALPAELIELLTHKADGNPLFVEEVTKSLLEEGVLRLENGRARLQKDLSQISVPDRIQDVLMARLDRLPEEPRRAIQVASVIGREFALRLLSQIREAGDRVQDVIGELRSLELIYEKAAHPELAFMFKHALTHDVAYESILHARRRTLHRVVGSAIEQLYGDRLAEHYEALAHHFERGEDWERALLYHGRAAEKAAAAFANQSVTEHCHAALAILDRLDGAEHRDERLHFEETLGEAYFALSEFPLSASAYLRAAELGERRSLNLAHASVSLVWAHEYDACLRAANEAKEIAERDGDDAVAALAGISTDLLKNATEGPGDHTDVGLATLHRSERSGHQEILSIALAERALYLEQFGSYREAIAVAERSIGIALDAGRSLLTVMPRWSLGKALTCVGDYARALEVFRKALDDCDRSGDRAFKTRLLNTLGWFHAEIHDFERAREYNEQGEAVASEMVRLELVVGAPELQANAAANLANNYTALGEPERALDLLGPMVEELDRPGDPWQRWRYEPHICDAMARVALAKERPDEALQWLEREVAISVAHNSAKLHARALELRGRTLVSMDLRDEAQQALSECIAVSNRIEYQPTLWRADSLLALLARRRGDSGEAERRAATARGRVSTLAAPLDGDLRRRMGELGEQLVGDALGAYR